MTKDQLQALAQDLIDCMPPQKVEIVAMTGEMLSVEALEIARLYDAASNGQRTAFDQIARAFRLDPPRNYARRTA